MSKDNIIVYGAQWCGFCHMAMQYFDKLGVKYQYVDVDKDPAGGQAAVDKSGQRGIPVIDLDGDIIVGFDRPKIDTALKAHHVA
ncbi:MAG TPA: glutaredoxin family protein [Candidatus Saccharimonadales bacterium]|nr:glutaredoxin family protein [Candidatus Saccharimonadales bacterium]